MLMMFPFEAPTIFEGVHKSHFRMPRVVRDQKGRFENDDLFRQLSNESLVKYTAYKDRPLEERQMKFLGGCQEGHTEISFTQSGNQFILTFNPTLNPAISGEGCDFEKEIDKVHIKSPFILNGVCVVWRGYIDLRRLDGSGCLEFDECRAYLEEHASKISAQDNSMNIKQQQQQPFNMLCNNSALNQGNVAAVAALAAASAATTNPFQPAVSSPLSRYPSAGATTALPPLPQHTPPSSQHQASRISPTLNNPHNNNLSLSLNLNPNNSLPQPAMTIPTTTTTPLTNGGCPPMQNNNLSNNNNSTTRSPQHQNNNINNHNNQLTQQHQQVPISQPPPAQMTQAHLAAAMGAMGGNGQGPPMSLADSYGNAAIAAAAAAAFHQALNASQQQQQHHQDYQQHLAQQHHHQQQQQNHHQQAVATAMGMAAPVDFLAEMSVHRQRAS